MIKQYFPYWHGCGSLQALAFSVSAIANHNCANIQHNHAVAFIQQFHGQEVKMTDHFRHSMAGCSVYVCSAVGTTS